MTFRQSGREALARAKELLAQGDDHSLRYAALELRMSMEATIYAMLDTYRREIPQSLYATWQPPKVIKFLLMIDPDADKSGGMALRKQEAKGVAGGEIVFRGERKRLEQKVVKDYYDRLGSYLHMPTVKQLQAKGGADLESLRTRCAKLVAALEVALDPASINYDMASFSTCDCFRCGKPVIRRLPKGQAGDLFANCLSCNASHRITIVDDRQEWRPMAQAIGCSDPVCDGTQEMFGDEIAEGKEWNCPKCGLANSIVLMAIPTAEVLPPAGI